MQLVTFQIKDCFGFRDSGQVDLEDPTNLIYVLGRNSSGKTSFLTALAHFAPRLTPQAHANFANFNASSPKSYLLGEYIVGEGDLTGDAFIDAYLSKMKELNQGTSATTVSKEYQQLRDGLAKELRTLYSDFIEKVMDQGNLWVRRNASGEYQFSTNRNFKDCTERVKQQVPRLLANVLTQLGLQVQQNNTMLISGSWQPFLQPTADEIESPLVRQLPRIASFSQEYSLLDALPDIIKIEHLTQSPGPLTTALIDYLGKTEVDRLLKGQSPFERREIKDRLQEKINALVDKVNQALAVGKGLLAIDLDRVDGLQVTVSVDSKPSFYRHLSDNTKLLFAFHLYEAVYNLSGNILLFDEPNNGFHATAQEQLLGFLRNLGAKGNLVVLSTHSEHLIDLDHLTGVRLMTADDQRYLSIRNKWYASTTGRGDFLAPRPILDAIGLNMERIT
jgi:energy-coupling factor transporter ATP-binding protein EcfA2